MKTIIRKIIRSVFYFIKAFIISILACAVVLGLALLLQYIDGSFGHTGVLVAAISLSSLIATILNWGNV